MAETAAEPDNNTSNIQRQERHQSSPSPSPPLTTSYRPPSDRGSRRKSSRVSLVTAHLSRPTAALPRRRSSSKSMSYRYHDGSSHNSSAAATPSVATTEVEVTYTEKLHRISKAKKGKKVHRCNYDNCDKVFTRAEHLKRHQANHSEEPLYKCFIEDCRKTFQRKDLLARHLDRQHNIISRSCSQQRRTMSRGSSGAASSQTNSPRTTRTVAGSPTDTISSVNNSSTGIPIESIIETTREPSPRSNSIWNNILAPSIPSSCRIQADLRPGLYPPDDSTPYSSEGSCYSPLSDCTQSYVRPQPYLPQYPDARARSTSHPIEMPNQGYSVPQSRTPSVSPWSGYNVTQQSSNGVSFGFESQFPAPVVGPQFICTAHEPPIDNVTDTLASTATPSLDRNGRDDIRRESGDAASVVAGQVASEDGMVKLDNGSVQHYYDCYWKNFHAILPIVHFSTLLSAPPPPLLTAIIIAIGAQFSLRPLSKTHSMLMFDLSSRLLSATDPVTSRAPLTDLQSIILLEAFALYRSRSPGVYKSARFSALYSSLLNDHQLEHHDSTTVAQRLSRTSSRDEILLAYQNWVDLEARRRILLAAFILDTHRSIFFEQLPHLTFSLAQGPQLPNPCSKGLWDCVDPTAWFALLSKQLTQSHTTIHSPLSPFQTSIYQCLAFHHHSSPPPKTPSLPLPKLPSSDLTHHALLFATHTPITSLLIVAGESWLFARKVEDLSQWEAAKAQLRDWRGSDASPQAAWHASQLLRTVFAREGEQGVNGTRMGLHEQWCLYLAALVCWAYGFAPQNDLQQSPRQLDLRQRDKLMMEYLDAMGGRSWKDVLGMRGKGGTRGLLECVRARIGGTVDVGRLVCEGGRVLNKLRERRKLCWF